MGKQAKEMDIICPYCNGQYDIQQMKVERRELGEGDYDIGIECPNCGVFLHSYFTNARLDQMRLDLAYYQEIAGLSQSNWQQYQAKLAEYQHEFDIMNQRLGVMIL